MSAPKRIQRKRTRGWRMPEGAVYVGRPSKWGNPYKVGEIATACGQHKDVQIDILVDADLAVVMFRSFAAERMKPKFYGGGYIGSMLAASWSERIRELAGHDLACWCPLEDAEGNRVPCHADVLLELANGEEDR